jgi:hypothetical protein
MKLKYNLLIAALLMPASNAAIINVFGDRNNPGAYGTSAATYSPTNWMKASFASLDAGIDGGLGTNIYVVHDDANLDGDGNPKTVKWTSNNTYFVRDKLFIPRGTTLTIEPGTKVYFSIDGNGTSVKADDAVGAITACRGGKLIADGTATAPIIFTTDREYEIVSGLDSPIDGDVTVNTTPLTSANAGLWGGIVLLGQAYCSFVNSSGVNAGTVQIEGFAPASSSSHEGGGDTIPDATQYGVSNNFPRKDDDNSGIVRYCSIRHGGYEFAAGREINGLTLGGVGSGTTIEFVEVYANLDDGIEFFGGRVSANNLIVAFAQDDMLDMDEGYRGTVQFVLCVQNPGDADGGGELDGVGNNFAGHPTISSGGTLHHSKPIVYNATVIGAGADNTKTQIPTRGTPGTKHVNWEKGNAAFIMEDYFNGEYYNSVYTDFAMGVIRFVDTLNVSPNFIQANISNNVVIQNCTFGNFGTFSGSPATSDADYITGASRISDVYDLVYDGFGNPLNGNTPTGTNPMFTTYTRDASTNVLTALNPVPAPGSPLLTAPLSGGAPKKVSYRGAFGPEGNWAVGWTKFWETGVLTGTAPAPAIVDADGDGISDTLEATPALTALGFSVGVNNVTNHGGVPGANRFSSLYTATTIQDLRGTGMMIGPVTPGGNAVLTLPLFKSDNLVDWTPSGNATATVPTPAGKQFFRVDLSENAPNP